MANLTLALTGVESDTVLGLLVAPGLVTLTLPTPKLEIASVGAPPMVGLTFLPTLAVTGSGGFLADVALTLPGYQLRVGDGDNVAVALPAPAVATSGLVGLVGDVALTLPPLSLNATAPNGVGLTLPAPTLSVSGRVGVTGSVSLTLTAPTLAATATVPFTAGAALTAPTPVLDVVGVVGATGAMVATLRGLALAAEGRTGTLGSVTLVLPVVSLDVEGYQPVIGVVALQLPSLQLRVTGKLAGQNAASTVVMHTEAQTLTTYSNFPFNSFALFNGVMLGASDDGVFALTGDTDNGAAINAMARVGISDFSTSHLKRIDRVYVGYRAAGDLVLRVFTDETEVRDYRLASTGQAGLHGNHARLGKGLSARYWQFEVRNQNGCDFDLNLIELKPNVLKRRIGGRDA